MRRVLNRLRHDPRFFEQLQRDSNFFTSTLDFRVAVWMTLDRACRALPHLTSDYLVQLLKDTWVGSLRANGWTDCADVDRWREAERAVTAGAQRSLVHLTELVIAYRQGPIEYFHHSTALDRILHSQRGRIR